MRKINIVVFLVVGLLLVGCSNTNDSEMSENNEPTLLNASRPTYSMSQITDEAEIIANLTLTELVEVREVSDEVVTDEYSVYKATVNHYLHNELGYDHEIEVLQAGGPNRQFSDDPLLEVGKTYILFLDAREDPNLGTNLVMTGGPQGRYNQDGDLFVRQLSISSDKGVSRLTEEELIQTLNERNEGLNIDLSIID